MDAAKASMFLDCFLMTFGLFTMLHLIRLRRVIMWNEIVVDSLLAMAAFVES
jgi:hypothetical protein